VSDSSHGLMKCFWIYSKYRQNKLTFYAEGQTNTVILIQPQKGGQNT